MIIHETLKELGISARQTDLYLTLLKLGPSSIRDIASSAGINRGTVYEELKRLRSMSLVTYFPQGKRKFFCAEPPDVLVKRARLIQQQTNEAADRLELEILPNLQAIMPDTTQTSVFQYEGDDGVEYVLRDILDTVGQSMRNANLQLRSDPVIAKSDIGPWNQSTIDGDSTRQPMEIGGRA